MVRILSIPVLILSLVVAHTTIGTPAPKFAIVGPLSCKLCEISTLPFPCESLGLAFAVQAHEFKRTDKAYSTIDIPYFHTKAPYQSVLSIGLQTGYTKQIGWEASGSRAVYFGFPNVATEFMAINHRSYFAPQSTGTYTFTAEQFDDAVFMWFGDDAFNGKYTKENAKIIAILEQPGVHTFSITLTAGTFHPMRILFVNAGGRSVCRFSITGPDGSVIFDKIDRESTPFLVPFTCDGTHPSFQNFGEETS